MENDFYSTIKKIILKNIEDEHFGVSQLANEIGLSRSQLLRKIKANCGKSVNTLIKEIRLNEALKLLQEGNSTMAEVAYSVGFSSPSYFSKCFHDQFGFPPGTYKLQLKDEQLKKHIKIKTPLSGSKLKLAFTVIVIVFILIFGYSSYQNINSVESIAVLPFINTSELDDQDYLVDGFTEAIILELSRRSDLIVSSRTSAMMYKNAEKSIQEIAKEMDVDLLLEGSFRICGDSLSVVTQLIEPFPKENHLWADRFNIKFNNVLHLVEQIAVKVADEIDVTLNPKSVTNFDKSVNSEAYNLYLKGRHLYNQQSSKSIGKAIEYLEKSIKLDPSFSPAYATLAEAFISFNKLISSSKEKPQNREKGLIAIERAINLDSSLGDNLITKGHILGKFKWDWDGMKYYAEKGLQLDPNNVNGHMLLSDYYLIKGDFNKAINEAQIASSLDQFNRATGVLLGERFFLAGKYEEALNQYEKVIELFPNYGFARDGIGHVQNMLGNKEDAMKSWAVLMRIMGNEVMATIFESEPYEITLNLWVEKATSKAPLFCSNPTVIAQALTYVNDSEGAMEYLEAAFKRHDEELPLALLRPQFAILHNDVRFRRLAENVGVQITYGIDILH